MTDKEIKREKTFEEELPYFKERIKEVFDNYHNPNGNEDTLEICVLRQSNRIIKKAEKTITSQQAELKRLQKENEILSANADNAFQEVKHGYWKWKKKIEPQATNRLYCFICDNECLAKNNYYVMSEYCPHCGAKMDGGKNG